MSDDQGAEREFVSVEEQTPVLQYLECRPVVSESSASIFPVHAVSEKETFSSLRTWGSLGKTMRR